MPILPHPTNYTQKTYYDCGPASLVVALAARGVSISESLAAAEAGTTTSGTPTILDIIKVLDKHLGAGTYRAAWIPGNSATPEQVAQLRTDLVASVDAGYALVANVVGTATTADGSEVNSYPGGHYLAPTGYDSGGDRAWIVDVADGHEYWMTTKALADWIAGRGYATISGGAWLMALTDDQQQDLYRRICNIDSFIYYGEVQGQATIPAGQVRLGYPVGTATTAPTPHVLVQRLAALDAKIATLTAPAPVDAAAVAKALLADPSFASMLAEAAFQGAQRAERE